MVIDELNLSPNFRLSRLIRVLEHLYDLTLDFNSVNNTADLESIYEEYGLVRLQIIHESRHNTYNQNPDYTKACLIQEAIHMYLSEVAPKRRNRKDHNKQGNA